MKLQAKSKPPTLKDFTSTGTMFLFKKLQHITQIQETIFKRVIYIQTKNVWWVDTPGVVCVHAEYPSTW